MLKEYLKKVETLIFILLIFLQVNFFHTFSFLAEPLVSLNSDINKQLILAVILFAFILLFPLIVTGNMDHYRYSFSLSIIVFIVSLLILTLLSHRYYQISWFSCLKSSYYCWIIFYFWPALFVLKNNFDRLLNIIKWVSYIDLLILLVQDFFLIIGKNLFIYLDEFSTKMLVINNRFVVDGDFLVFAAFCIFMLSIYDEKKLDIFEISYISFLILHQSFFSKGRVSLLILLLMVFVYFISYINKTSYRQKLLTIVLYLSIVLVSFYFIIKKMEFFSGSRSISGLVRIYESMYYITQSTSHGFWGIGFTDDASLLYGGINNYLGGKYSFTDVGVIGYLGVFGFLGLPFLLSYIYQFFKLERSHFNMEAFGISFCYIFGQWLTLFPLNISRIFLFTVTNAILVVFLNNKSNTGVPHYISKEY